MKIYYICLNLKNAKYLLRVDLTKTFEPTLDWNRTAARVLQSQIFRYCRFLDQTHSASQSVANAPRKASPFLIDQN